MTQSKNWNWNTPTKKYPIRVILYLEKNELSVFRNILSDWRELTVVDPEEKKILKKLKEAGI